MIPHPVTIILIPYCMLLRHNTTNSPTQNWESPKLSNEQHLLLLWIDFRQKHLVLVSVMRPIIHPLFKNRKYIQIIEETPSVKALDSWNHKLPACHSVKHSCTSGRKTRDVSDGPLDYWTTSSLIQDTLKIFLDIAMHYQTWGSLWVLEHNSGLTPHTYPGSKFVYIFN